MKLPGKKSSPSPMPTSAGRQQKYFNPQFIALLLALATILVYLPTGGFSFVNYDDNDYITGNAVVRSGLTWAGFQWAFTAFHAGNWHPLTWLSHMADCEMFRLNAGAHHLINALWHALNSALVFLLLARLANKIWPAALAAALFAWHPVHVESVAWVSERKDVLSTFFGLLTLLCYTRFATGSSDKTPSRKNIYYALALVCFALGLMAKPMLVTLPFIMLLLDFWPFGRTSPTKDSAPDLATLFLEKIPFLVLTAASCFVTLAAQRQAAALASLTELSFAARCENAVVALVLYFKNLVWPSGLCALYPLENHSPLRVGLALLLLTAITFTAWQMRRAKPYLLVGWLWFVGMLVPVIGLVQVGGQAMADRYMYLPSIGIFFALAVLAAEFVQRFSVPKNVAGVAAAFVCLACIAATEKQMMTWRNGESLFRRCLAVTQNNVVAMIDLGVALNAQSRTAEAVEIYRDAEKIRPDNLQLKNNLANALGILGRHAESLAEYREAIQLQPKLPVLHHGAGVQLAHLGRHTDALQLFLEALRLDPNLSATHLEAAKSLFALGRDAEGVDEFRAAVRLAPNHYPTIATAAHFLAANQNNAMRDGTNALQLALVANELSAGQQPMVCDILGMAYAATGDFTNAVASAQKAVNLATAAQMKNIAPLQQRLQLYQQNQPWRESFRATNAP